MPHKKKLAFMNQPAEGWYADCLAHGHVGSLFPTKEATNQEWDRHLKGESQRNGKWTPQ